MVDDDDDGDDDDDDDDDERRFLDIECNKSENDDLSKRPCEGKIA